SGLDGCRGADAGGVADHDLEHPARHRRGRDPLMAVTTTSAENLAASRAGTRKRIFGLSAGRLAAHLALLFFVVLWTFPTAGLLISSVRDADQLAASGWWTALSTSTTTTASRLPAADAQVEEGGQWVIRGNVLGDATSSTIETFGATNASLGD